MSYNLKITGQNLPIADFRSSDPYFKIMVDNEKKYESEYIEKNLNPVWAPLEVHAPASVLKFGGNGSAFYIADHDVLVTMEVWDKDGLSKDDFMGKVVLPLKRMLESGEHDLMDKKGRPVKNKEKSKLKIEVL